MNSPNAVAAWFTPTKLQRHGESVALRDADWDSPAFRIASGTASTREIELVPDDAESRTTRCIRAISGPFASAAAPWEDPNAHASWSAAHRIRADADFASESRRPSRRDLVRVRPAAREALYFVTLVADSYRLARGTLRLEADGHARAAPLELPVTLVMAPGAPGGRLPPPDRRTRRSTTRR